jgi:hypothetical protein
VEYLSPDGSRIGSAAAGHAQTSKGQTNEGSGSGFRNLVEGAGAVALQQDADAGAGRAAVDFADDGGVGSQLASDVLGRIDEVERGRRRRSC